MPNPILVMLIVLAAFALAASSDYLETRYVQAVQQGAARRAATYSIAMWAVGIVGLAAILEIGWWVLIPEGAGLYFGTMRAMR